MTSKAIVTLPGVLRRNDAPQNTGAAWHVTIGRPVRGDAWTDPESRSMRVPGARDKASETIRAHEMMHARVSPACDAWKGNALRPKLPFDLMQVCEEMRVNWLLKLVGFDTDWLCDGSEYVAGTRCEAVADVWPQAVFNTVAGYGGKACSEWLRGLDESVPEWAFVLRALVRELDEYVADEIREHGQYLAQDIGCTDPVTVCVTIPEYARDQPECDDGEELYVTLPQGFVTTVPELADLVSRYLMADPLKMKRPGGTGKALSPDDVHRLTKTADALCEQAGWAPLVFGETRLTKVAPGLAVARKRRAHERGVRVGYPSRLLTDPKRRVFTSSLRARPGGVVVLDASGSMSISEDDIYNMLRQIRGLTIVAYSAHDEACDSPNIWTLAHGGKCVEALPDFPGGNACDGMALRYGVSIRKPGQPLVWVSDGGVYGLNSTRDAYDAAVLDCATLVRVHGIHWVVNIDEAVSSFRRGVAHKRHVPDYGDGWDKDTLREAGGDDD